MKRFSLLAIVFVLTLACLCSCDLLFGEKPCEHSEAVDAAVSPTCTETGLTEGKHCSVCGEVIVKQEVISALGHTEVIDEAVPATCTEDGLTAGVHCSVCNTTVIAQEVVPAAHTYGEWENVVAEATCFTDGSQERSCSVCGELDSRNIEKLSHSFIQDEETKLFSCEICDARIYAGHLYAAFDVEVNWYDAYKICDNMGGHLVTITSEGEQNIITEIINSRTLPANRIEYYYLTGGLKNTSGWEWITDEEMSYTHWGPQLDGDQWYIGLTTKLVSSGNQKMKVGDWEDLSHAEKWGFICEWELDITEDEHFLTEWENTTEVTCFGDGEQYRVCTHCGLEETEVLPQLEHNFVFNEATGVTVCEHCGAALYNGHIYKIFTVQLSWFDAYSYCDELGGHLVTITSQEEQTFIETYMNSQSFSTHAWIGAYNDGTKWQWITNEVFEYMNWTKNQPDCSNGIEFFGHINWLGFGLWNDVDPYNDISSFVCEWEAE